MVKKLQGQFASPLQNLKVRLKKKYWQSYYVAILYSVVLGVASKKGWKAPIKRRRLVWASTKESSFWPWIQLFCLFCFSVVIIVELYRIPTWPFSDLIIQNVAFIQHFLRYNKENYFSPLFSNLNVSLLFLHGAIFLFC